MKNIKKFLSFIVIINVVLIIFSSCKKTVTIGTKTLDASKNYTIYIAQSAEKVSLDDMRKGFVIGMKDNGLVEDVNVKYIYENALGNKNYAKQIAENVNEIKPDIVVAIGSIVAEEIFNECKKTKIVFLGCANADKLGFCDKKGMPNGEITGVIDSHRINERLDFIEENYSNVKKLGIIYDSSDSLASYDVDYHKFYATGHDIDIYTVAIKKASDIDKALDNIIPKVDALSLVVDNTVDSVVPNIVERCILENKPVFGKAGEHREEGIIIEKEADMQDIGKKASEMVKDILVNGKKPSEINVITIK